MPRAEMKETLDETPEKSRDPSGNDDGMSELRSLLLAPERAQMRKLQEQLDDPEILTDRVSHILPQAVTLRSGRDQQLFSALTPIVEETIGASVKRNPQHLVDAIFPVMGPAIRKAISHAFSEMVQSLNQTLEYSVSMRGLKWRLEALRTGKSFAEVVLSHTLLYRVEQVFLIHRDSGLLLQQITAPDKTSQDPDLVSAMLTAIGDFVHDSFGTDNADALEAMQVGELTVWVEQGSQAILAGVIRGVAPQELRRVFQDALDRIHAGQSYALETFNGDPSRFEATRPILEDCLRMQVERPAKKPSLLLWGLAVALLLAIGAWAFISIRDSRRWNGYLDALSAQPGIVVVSSDRRDGKYQVTGLRDPLAIDPSAVLKSTAIDPADVVGRWESYHSSSPDFVMARAANLLRPPATASLSFADGVLSADGVASRTWIAQARQISQLIPGVSSFDVSGLTVLEQLDGEIESTRRMLESRIIRFEVGSSEISAEQSEELKSVASDVRRLEALFRHKNSSMRVEITGYADRAGTQEINRTLRLRRAEAVMSALSSQGLGSGRLSVADPDKGSREPMRKVTFTIHLESSPQASK